MVIRQRHLIEFQIYYLLVVEAAISLLHMPVFIKYLLDVNAIVIFVMGLPKVYDMFRDRRFNAFNIYIIIYMIAIVGISLMRYTPVGRVFWAARNNFFFILFFLVAAYTIKPKDYIRIMDNVTKLQFFNIACVFYERVFLGCFGDNIGGMFGIQYGCNTFLNVYLFIINAYAIVSYVSKRFNIYMVGFVVLSSMIISVSAELKFFYIEFAVIILLMILLSRTSFRNAMVVIVTVVLLFVGVQVLSRISPESAKVLNNFEQFISYASETFEGQKISRMTAFAQVNDYFLRNRPKYVLFGYGFGYAESSNTFRWATSVFSVRYGSTGYRNLSASMNLIETGYVGIIAFITIFIWMFFSAQVQKSELPKNKPMFVFVQIIAIMVIINIWYNSAIRLEVAYLTYFSLIGVIIFSREKMKEDYYKKLEEYNRKRGITKTSIKFRR